MLFQLPRRRLRLCAVFAGVASVSLLSAGAHATQATTDFSVKLSVSSPKCTVTTSAADIQLVKGTSPQQGLKAYLQTAGFDLANKSSDYFPAPGKYDQVATISCTTPATPINSILVKPIATEVKSKGRAYFVDSKGNKAAKGDLTVVFEQLEVNGKGALHSYIDEKPYKPSDAFLTQDKVDGVATVSWRPLIWWDNDGTPLGTPENGKYSVSGQIVVDY